jgi:hypothetical protein
MKETHPRGGIAMRQSSAPCIFNPAKDARKSSASWRKLRRGSFVSHEYRS